MKKIVLIVMLFSIASLLVPNFSVAQRSSAYQYAVKCVCGKPYKEVLAAGRYFTAINVHNPTADTVVFKRKLASTRPGGDPGLVSKFDKSVLMPDQALEIDCAEVFEQARRARISTDFFKGFVVIESDVELDVVAVYTAAGATGQVETMHVEPVSPRRLLGCPDLVVVSIDTPIWDRESNRSVIRATIKNIGNAIADSSSAQLIDLTTPGPGPYGVPYNDVAYTPELAPGAVATVTFYLTNWGYKPNVTLEVTADYRNELSECNENNNVKTY